MNMPLTTEEIRRLTVNTDEFLIRTGIKAKQPRAVREKGDYAESKAGRNRRDMRRQVLVALLEAVGCLGMVGTLGQ